MKLRVENKRIIGDEMQVFLVATVPYDRDAYEQLQLGTEHDLDEALLELGELATETIPALVTECGAYEACTLPLGHEGPHTDKATARAFEQALGAREATPESAHAQEKEALA